jgi:cleavage and polyadenylation specificity factor subunit 2
VIRNEESVEGEKLVLDLQPAEEQRSRVPVTVGDVKLSELKKLLGQQGYNAQFISGGVLVVNESIVIQKTEQGQLTVQGQVDDDYYNVRQLIYSFQAIL